MSRVWRGLLLSAAVLTTATCDDPSVGPPDGSSGGPPAAPVNVTASVGSAFNEVVVTWPAVLGVTSYNVYWGTTPGVTTLNGTKIPRTCPGPTCTLTHSGLTASTTYYYVVTGVNDAGESPASATAHATASGDIALQVACPNIGALGGTPLKVAVQVVSHYQVDHVTASVGGRTTDLAFDPLTLFCSKGAFAYPAWVGTISLAGLPMGATTLAVSARDVYGNVAAASRGFVHDEVPSVTVAAPDDFYVARPSVRVTASCVNDAPGGCASVAVSVNGDILATAPGNLDQTVSLAAYDGQSVQLLVEGLDGAGQSSRVSRRVFVESSTHLSEVASVNGLILDVQSDRILFLNQSGGGSTLTIRNRTSGSDVVIYDVAGHLPESGRLTPVGAIFVEQTSGQNIKALHEWTTGGLSDLGSNTFVAVKDQYALFRPVGGLTRRDVVAGANTFVTSDAASGDVGPNGDVAYSSSGYQIMRYRNGTSTPLTSDATLWNVFPVTDGVNVVYRKNTPCCSGQEYQIATYGASGEQILTALDGVERRPGLDYQAVNGWIAYTKSINGALNVWSRSPAGQDVQATQLSGTSSIDALSPNGEIAVVNAFLLGNGNGFVKRRYLAVPNYTTQPRDISSGLGCSFFVSGSLYVAIGRSLFLVNP